MCEATDGETSLWSIHLCTSLLLQWLLRGGRIVLTKVVVLVPGILRVLCRSPAITLLCNIYRTLPPLTGIFKLRESLSPNLKISCAYSNSNSITLFTAIVFTYIQLRLVLWQSYFLNTNVKFKYDLRPCL